MKKGPLVYCIEQIDNGENLSGIFVDTTQEPKEQYRADVLGGTMTLELAGKRMRESDWESDCLYREKNVALQDTKITMVPYCCWGNRAPGEMQVWMKLGL